MTLGTIKDTITDRLREILKGAEKFRDIEGYREFVDLVHETISRVYLCESASDLEETEEPLGRIEDAWNALLKAQTPDAAPEILFEFSFTLSDSDDEVPDDEDEEETTPSRAPVVKAAEAVSETEETDDADETDGEDEDGEEETVTVLPGSEKLIDEIEEFYGIHAADGGFFCRAKLRSIRKKATGRVRSAVDKASLTDASLANRRDFKRFLKRVDRYEKLQAAKPEYDKIHTTDRAVNFNVTRCIVGIIALLSGIGIGLIEAFVATGNVWPWIDYVWAVVGFGASYLLLSAVYGIVISKSVDVCAMRRMSFARLILSFIFIAGCLAVLIIAPFPEWALYAAVAALPFTLGGIFVYLNYRVQLRVCAKPKKPKKEKKDKDKNKKEN